MSISYTQQRFHFDGLVRGRPLNKGGGVGSPFSKHPAYKQQWKLDNICKKNWLRKIRKFREIIKYYHFFR